MDIDELFSVFEQPPIKTSGQCDSASEKTAKSSSSKRKTDDPSQPSFDGLEKLISKAKKAATDEPKDSSKSLSKKLKPDDSENQGRLSTGKKELDDLLSGVNEEDFSSRISTMVINNEGGCFHQVCLPPDVDYQPLKPLQAAPAVVFPFTLDPFQTEAILCLENMQSCLVSAHTSSGKTVVAEYAIGMSLRDNQRVIYTTPIKALSNQKYREFCEKFKSESVGIMTGDITLNPSAACVIMTTEILRSMLYRGSKLLRDVGWVIFDEIHYMRDKDRGVVWEESIILLPDNIHSVFLSATIPNARQFAEWVCFLHNQPCHVVYTDYRPVPLQQFIFPYGADSIYLVVDEEGSFKSNCFNQAMDALQSTSQQGKRNAKSAAAGNCSKVVKMVMEKGLAPVIVFSFSKKECELYATELAKLDFNTAQEQALIEEVFKNAIESLSDEDKKIPQVNGILPILKRGIGIHHSGLLPILKETVEILFGEGLIKALFATETFAMGLNMPARTVLFTNARKFDGKDFRWITSGEYIQMSGRAGRRGIDDRGIVILMIDEKMNPSAAKNIVKGSPDPINSAFHLTYNMVLNLLRVDGIEPEFILEKSFFQFQNYAKLPKLYQEATKNSQEYSAIHIPHEEDIMGYNMILNRIAAIKDEIYAFTRKPKYCLPFLRYGRLIKVKAGNIDFGYGVVSAYKRRPHTEFSDEDPESYVVYVYLQVSKECAGSNTTSDLKPPEAGEVGVLKVVPIKMTLIQEISSACLKIPKEAMEDNMSDALCSLTKSYPDGIPLLHPVEDMGIRDENLKLILKKLEVFKQQLEKHPLKNRPEIKNWVALYKKKKEYEAKLREATSMFKKTKSLVKMDELKCRKRILRRLGFCDSSDIIELKGRVACEISSGHELLLTEMIYSGVLNDLTPHQLSALCSCFVFEEKSTCNPKLTEDLTGPLRAMQEKARHIAEVSKESRLEIDVDEYVNSFKNNLMDVVHEWSKGKPFIEICGMTDVFEGSIIRCLRRLEELLRQMTQAAKAIGNVALENKFSESIRLLKRDIVFAASLYL